MSKIINKVSTISQPVEIDIDPNFNYISVTWKAFSDSGLVTLAKDILGLLKVEGMINGSSEFQEFEESPLDLTRQYSYAKTFMPLSKLKVTPINISANTGTVSHYQVTITLDDEV